MKRCKGCGQMINFVKNKDGKYIPVDSHNIYTTNAGGSIVLDDGEVIQCSSLKKAIKAWRPHWGNCTAVEQFRKEKSEK